MDEAGRDVAARAGRVKRSRAAAITGPAASVPASTGATEPFRALNEPDGQAPVAAFGAVRHPLPRQRVFAMAPGIAGRISF